MQYYDTEFLGTSLPVNVCNLRSFSDQQSELHYVQFVNNGTPLQFTNLI